jgi:hypothetical protein
MVVLYVKKDIIYFLGVVRLVLVQNVHQKLSAQCAVNKINYLMGFVHRQLVLHHVQDAMKVNAMNVVLAIYS